MGYIKKLLYIFVLLFPIIVNAGWIGKDGKKIPDSDKMKSSDDFIAQLVITDNEKKALKNWGTTSQTVYFLTANKIEKNKIITAFVVFGGCKVDFKGNCNLKMQFTVYQPDGSIYSKLPLMEVWSNKPVPPNKTLGLSVEYMRVIIESHDQLGKYVIKTNIVDNNSGKTMELSSYFIAVKASK